MQPGDTILDKYRVEEVLGTGGMGKVVRASHLHLQQEFAIKVLLPHMAESAETVSRFLREAQSTSKLKSEHIARVFDVGRLPDGVPFMVMEYLQGNDLNQILRHHGPQRAAVVCDLMLQACEGMAEAHSHGIVHRDIKPSNFFITTKPDGTMLLKILDFGISKTPVGVTELTGSATVIGTPTYMSPEQMKSGRAADARSDVWSMGIVIYQLLNGRPPFVGESYAELVLKVGSETPPPISVPLPQGLMGVIMQCLDKDPNKRQQTVADLARMLAPYASDPVQGMQAAQRTQRTLANRNSAGGGSLPITSGGGLAPLSPAQLTPRSWPPNAPTTSSHGRGQVTHTHHVRSSWRIGRVIGAFVVLAIAGVGGFFAKDLIGGSDDDDSDDTTHVSAPPPASDPPPPVAVAKPETPATVAKPDDAAAKADAAAKSDGAAKSDEAKPAPSAAPEPDPTLESEALRASNKIDVAAADAVTAKTEVAKPTTETKVATDAAKPAVTATKPVTKTTTTKPDATKPTLATKPTTTKPTTTKPVVKKKKGDDLFNTRH